MFCERAFTPCWFVEVQFVRERRGGGGGGEEGGQFFEKEVLSHREESVSIGLVSR